MNGPIVHIFNSAVVSGPETLVMPALKHLGRDVAIINLSEDRTGDASQKVLDYAKGLGYPVHSVRVRSRWDSQAFKDLRDLLERLKPSIAHAHDVKASLYLWRALKRGLSFEMATVSTHHGAAARKGKIRVYEELYVRWVLPNFDRVLCVCKGDYESLKRRRVPERLLEIHHNGVDRPKVPLSERAARREKVQAEWRKVDPSLPEDAFFLGAVARLSEEKRHDRMLRALAEVKRKRPDLRWTFLAFGIGALEQPLKALTRELGLEDEVHWMGYRGSIGQEIAGFDLLMALSDGEGIPINLLEAGWAGTPVLSTNVGGIPDIIQHRKTGFLVEKAQSDPEIADTLIQILDSPAEREAMGAAFQVSVERRFSQKAWLEKLARVYSQIEPR